MTYHMKLIKADEVIKTFQGGQNIFRRRSMFSMVVEVEKLRSQLAEAQAEVKRLQKRNDNQAKTITELLEKHPEDEPKDEEDSGSYDSLIEDTTEDVRWPDPYSGVDA